MLGASNLRQQKRLWTVLEHPEMIKRTNDERDADRAREEALLAEIMRTRDGGGVGGVAAGAPRAGGACAHDGRGGGRSADRLARRAASVR